MTDASVQNVPVTAVSAFPNSRPGTELAIGSNFFTNNLGSTAGYWFVAVETMQFMPVNSGGQIIYVPIQIGSAG